MKTLSIVPQSGNSANAPQPLLIDTAAAAALLGLKESRIRMAVHRKEIPYRKIGSLVRFVPEELKAWINSEQLRPKLHS